jgi:hypothetical protein
LVGAVADQHMTTGTERLQSVYELLIVEFIERGVDRAAATIGFAEKIQYFMQRVAGKVLPRLVARGG